MRAGEAHGPGNAVTIFAQSVEGRIGLDCQIHFSPGNEVVQVARRHIEAVHGVDERGQHFRGAGKDLSRQGRTTICASGAGDGFVEGSTPFSEAALLRGDVVAFIRNIVDGTHEGVESSEAVALGLWEEIEGVIKIAAGCTGDLVASFVGLGDGRGGIEGRQCGRRAAGRRFRCCRRRRRHGMPCPYGK